MRRIRKGGGGLPSELMAYISRPRRSLYLDSLLCHRREVLEESLTPSTSASQASMSGLKREDSPEQAVNGSTGNEPPSSSGRERRSSFSSSTTGDSGYGGSVLGNTFLEHKTIQHFESGDDYLLAMLEDLAEWFSNIYDLDVTVETLFSHLESGVLLCRHAHEVHKAGEEYIKLNQRRDLPMKVGNKVLVIPQQPPNYRANAQPGTFVARDNVANFIHWCRAFGIPDCLSFETEDLVLRKNVRSVVLCLLEIGRVGAKFGMEAPDLVIMEAEIDAEIEADAARARAERGEEEEEEYEIVEEEFDELEEEEMEEREGEAADGKGDGLDLRHRAGDVAGTRGRAQEDGAAPDVTDCKPVRRLRKRMVRRPKVVRPPYQAPPLIPEPPVSVRRQRPRPKCDMRSLDEMVRDIIKECTCDETFPMKRLGEGKYQFGDNSTLIFVRILRYHVMVRVGGGWDTLNHFLEKYDPCRKNKAQTGGKPSQCAHRHSGVFGSRDQSEEPVPLRASTPRKAAAAGAAASCLEDLQQRQSAPNRNFKEGMMNLTRTNSSADKMRSRTKSVDVGNLRSPPAGSAANARNSMPKSNRSSCEIQEAPVAEEAVKLRSSSSKVDQLPQEPVDRIGSLYLHNTVDDLRRYLKDWQTTQTSTKDDGATDSQASAVSPSLPTKEKPPALPVPSCGESEVLTSREMYQRMQKDFEMMRMGVDMADVRPRAEAGQDDDAVSVASSCSSASSAATTGSRRFTSRIPVPVRFNSPRSNPTTPEMTRRRTNRAGSLRPESSAGLPTQARLGNRRMSVGVANRRSSIDNGRLRSGAPTGLTRRSSITATGAKNDRAVG